MTYCDRVNWNTSYATTLRRLVQTAPGDGDVVVVSHREGIRGLVKKRLRTPYCVQAEFVITASDSTWAVELEGLHTIGADGEKLVRKKIAKKPAAKSKPGVAKKLSLCC